MGQNANYVLCLHFSVYISTCLISVFVNLIHFSYLISYSDAGIQILELKFGIASIRRHELSSSQSVPMGLLCTAVVVRSVCVFELLKKSTTSIISTVLLHLHRS